MATLHVQKKVTLMAICDEWVGPEIRAVAERDVRQALLLLLQQAVQGYDVQRLDCDFKHVSGLGIVVSASLTAQIKQGVMRDAHSSTLKQVIEKDPPTDKRKRRDAPIVGGHTFWVPVHVQNTRHKLSFTVQEGWQEAIQAQLLGRALQGLD